MRKLILLIISITSSTLVVAKNFPPQPRDTPCDPILGCDGVSLDGYIPFMIFGALLLGSWVITRGNKVKEVE